jgi:hypothetical protein
MSSPTFAVMTTVAPGATCQRDVASQKSCARAVDAVRIATVTKAVRAISEPHDQI